MRMEKPLCNFQNCKYHQDGNCVNASKYENCNLTDLHCEIARLRVDLDNAKAEQKELIKANMRLESRFTINEKFKVCNIIGGAQIYTETVADYNKLRADFRADTVRKMQERLKAQKFTHKTFGELVYVEDIDQIAKEMLEGNNEEG